MLFSRYIAVYLVVLFSFPVVSFSANESSAIGLTAKEKEFVKNHSQVVLGAGASFEPFIIQNPDGSFSGHDIDVIRQIEKNTGLDIRLEIGVWEDVQEKAKSRVIDGLITAVQTKERELLFDQSLPYVHFTNLVIVKKGNPPGIFNISDVSGKTVALQQGNQLFIRTLEQLDVVVKVVYYETIHEVISAVISGDADFTILDETAPYIASKLGLGENVEAAFTIGEPFGLMILTRNDWPELVAIINKGLRGIDVKERLRIRNLWFGSINKSIDYSLLWKLSSALVAVLLLILFWVYTLNISKKKTELALKALELKDRELELKNKMLRDLAITDQLTQIHNRLMLDQSLEQEIIRAERYQGSFGVIILDIDDFKSVNDIHGHQVGDQVLIEVAELIDKYSRNADIVGRWGGEEFLIISPGNETEGLAILAENLRKKIEQYEFSMVKNKTISLGCALYQAGDDITSLINRADKALYQAKEKGKNCVVMAENELPIIEIKSVI